MVDALIEAVWPSVCVGCAREGAGAVCPACLPRGLLRPRLPIPGVRGIFAAARYPSVTGQALARAKYGRRRDAVCYLADGFAAALLPGLLPGAHGVSAVVPVPASFDRRVARGFVPALLLADALANGLGVPRRDVLTAARGPHQVALAGAARRRALAGRIRCETPMTGRVLLVDDVVTTGATVEACARELLGAGASEIWVAAVCVVDVTTAKNL